MFGQERVGIYTRVDYWRTKVPGLKVIEEQKFYFLTFLHAISVRYYFEK